MRDFAKILDEDGVDLQDGVLFALGLNDIADGERANITAVFEISRVERFQAYFVENLAAFGPCLEDASGADRSSAIDVLVLVVFLGTANDAVLNHVLDDLGDFGLRERHVDDETD